MVQSLHVRENGGRAPKHPSISHLWTNQWDHQQRGIFNFLPQGNDLLLRFLVHFLHAPNPFAVHHGTSTSEHRRRLLPSDPILGKFLDFCIYIRDRMVLLRCDSWSEYQIQLYSNVHLSIRCDASWPKEVQWFRACIKDLLTRVTWSRDLFGRDLSTINIPIHRIIWNYLAHIHSDRQIDIVLELKYSILAAFVDHGCTHQIDLTDLQQV